MLGVQGCVIYIFYFKKSIFCKLLKDFLFPGLVWKSLEDNNRRYLHKSSLHFYFRFNSKPSFNRCDFFSLKASFMSRFQLSLFLSLSIDYVTCKRNFFLFFFLLSRLMDGWKNQQCSLCCTYVEEMEICDFLAFTSITKSPMGKFSLPLSLERKIFFIYNQNQYLLKKKKSLTMYC